MYKGKKIIAINFCDEKFEKTRKICSETLLSKGKVDEVIEYSPSMIDEEFRKKNHRILSVKRGAGLWLWKPYFIFETLKKMSDGDYLFYTDAGVIVLKPISLLLPSLETTGQDIMVYELPLLEREWTKQETINIILGDKECNDNQILATYLLIRNTLKSRKFISEWLDYMQDPICAYPENQTDTPNHPHFVEHREDQSVLSLLCRKHGLSPFKDPSQFGERPYEYAWNKSYSLKWKRYSYREMNHFNSSYPQILLTVRSADTSKMIKRENIKAILNRFFLYNKIIYKIKNGCFFSVLD